MAAPTQLTSAPMTCKINGVDLHEYGVVEYTVPQLGMAPVNVAFQSLPSRAVAVPLTGAANPMPFTITGRIFDNTVAALRTHLDNLKNHLPSLRHRNLYYDRPTPIYIELADQSDRQYPCHYIGPLTVSPAGRKPSGGEVATFTLPLIQLTPFALAVAYTTVAPGGTGPTFEVLDTGTAPCPAVIDLVGASTAPSFGVCNMGFHARYDYSLNGTIIDGTTVTGAMSSGTKSAQFAPGQFDKGRFTQTSSAFDTTWAGVINNPDQFTFIVAGRAVFAATVAADQYLATWDIHADNRAEIWFRASDDKWCFTRRRATVDFTQPDADASTHAADTYVVLAGSAGPDGIKLYLNGVLVASASGTTTGVVGESGTMRLGHHSTAANNADFKHEYTALFPFQLSDEDVAKYSGNPELMAPANVVKSKTGNLAANERAVIHTDRHTITKIATDLTQTADISDWDNGGFVDLHPNKSCFYVPTSEVIAGVSVAYRKIWW